MRIGNKFYKKILIISIVVLSVIFLFISLFYYFYTNKTKSTNPDITLTNNVEDNLKINIESDFADSPIKLNTSSPSVTPINPTSIITATTSFLFTNNHKLVWSIKFKNPTSSWAIGKNVNDYIKLNVSPDSLICTFECLKDFGEQIIFKVAYSYDESINVTGTIDYNQKVNNFSLVMVRDHLKGSIVQSREILPFGNLPLGTYLLNENVVLKSDFFDPGCKNFSDPTEYYTYRVYIPENNCVLSCGTQNFFNFETYPGNPSQDQKYLQCNITFSPNYATREALANGGLIMEGSAPYPLLYGKNFLLNCFSKEDCLKINSVNSPEFENFEKIIRGMGQGAIIGQINVVLRNPKDKFDAFYLPVTFAPDPGLIA